MKIIINNSSLQVRAVLISIVLSAAVFISCTARTEEVYSEAILDATAGWEYQFCHSPLDAQGVPLLAYSENIGSGWIPLKYPRLIKRKKAKEMWMRFKLPSGNWSNPGLYIDGAYLAFEVYSGKEKIYSYGNRQRIDNNEVVAPKWHFVIPLKNEYLGKHLYFRLYSHWHIGIIGNVKIGERPALLTFMVLKDIDKIILSAIFLMLGMVSLIVYLNRIKQTIYLYFGLTVLSMIGVGVFYTGVGKLFYNNQLFWLYLRQVSLFVFYVLFYVFFEKIFTSGNNKWIRIYWQLAAVLSITSTVLFSVNMSFFKLFYLLNALVFFVGNLAVAVYAMRKAIRSDTESRLFSIGVIFFLATAVYDNLQGNAVVPWSRFYSGWGALVFFGFLTIILSKRFSTVYLKLHEYSKNLENALSELEKHSEVINRQFMDSIHIIYSLIASSSSRIYEDTNECSKISVLLAEKLGLPSEEIENIKVAAMLHHLGLVGLVDRLMRTKSQLTDEEIQLLKMHPRKSVEIIESLTGSEKIEKIILQHHERYDGSGYPLGLKHDQIVCGAQIIGLVDDFIFLRRKRDYQAADKHDRILEELKSYSGTLFDDKLVQALIELIDEVNLIYLADESDIRIDVTPESVLWNIPSNIHFEPLIADRVVKEVQRRTGMKSDMAYTMDYSLCEVVRNAIVHGNRYNENKMVTIELHITPLESDAQKIMIQVSDEGEGMDVKEHDKFFKSRKELANIIDKLNKLEAEPAVKEKIRDIVIQFNNFRREYYLDYNSFRQIEGTELTGGIGLVHVLSFFDNVKFSNIIVNSRIKGFQVTLYKVIHGKA